VLAPKRDGKPGGGVGQRQQAREPDRHRLRAGCCIEAGLQVREPGGDVQGGFGGRACLGLGCQIGLG
jgi:hypothetical protein